MRIFMAIEFPEEIKEIIIQRINLFKKLHPQFKWIKRPALHLTLKFIGELPDTIIPGIYNQLKEAFLHTDPFNLASGPLGFFPSAKRARVFFLDLKKSDPLEICYQIIENRLELIGIEKDKRAFHPHITLARIKNFNLTSEQSQALQSQSMPQIIINVNEIILMQSELSASGARYTPVQRFSLRKK
jgi:RNA 2',3'-cyclic 3'-phosphodiesterase